jgi:hypothetical protein
MSAENQELVIGEPLRFEQAPRSMVSLDHNGESTRIVCFGGNNTIVIGEGSTPGQEPRSVHVSNVVWPSVFVMLGFAVLGVAIGVIYADVIRQLLV